MSTYIQEISRHCGFRGKPNAGARNEELHMKNDIYAQLAHSSLLPDDMAAAILAGHTPPVEELVMALVIAGRDVHAVVAGSGESSWNEKRLARMVLAVAFLSAMAIMGQA
jgi:phosphohistidine phosphatase SixA